MTANDLINIFLRLDMAGKGESSDLAFDAGKDGLSPFGITGVRLDEDGDICLESDVRVERTLNASELAEAVRAFDGEKTIYFLSIDRNGEAELYNIKDGGWRDRHDPEIKLTPAGALAELLGSFDPEKILHFESGTINFTINSVYHDEEGRFCLESNEIMELDNYPVGMVVEELHSLDPETSVYFYDDEAGEYYGIYQDECRVSEDGDIWIKAR